MGKILKVLCTVMLCVDQWEIALTYISSVFHRSVASPHVCSPCDGDGRHHDALPGRLGSRLCLDLRHPLPARMCDSLNQRLCSDAHGDPDLSALFACRGCAAGGWGGPWSSPSEQGHGTRVWGSSPHLEFGSNLTTGKTESHVRQTKQNHSSPTKPRCLIHVDHQRPTVVFYLCQGPLVDRNHLTWQSVDCQGQKHRFC